MYPPAAIAQYQQLDLEGNLASASPRKRVSLILARALSRLAAAHVALARGDVSTRTNELNGVIDILAALRNALDLPNGGQLAQNLEDLYSYMELQVVQANLHNDGARIMEVLRLLGELKSAWDAMPAVD